jgi:hypothetical protein
MDDLGGNTIYKWMIWGVPLWLRKLRWSISMTCLNCNPGAVVFSCGDIDVATAQGSWKCGNHWVPMFSRETWKVAERCPSSNEQRRRTVGEWWIQPPQHTLPQRSPKDIRIPWFLLDRLARTLFGQKLRPGLAHEKAFRLGREVGFNPYIAQNQKWGDSIYDHVFK